VKHRIACRDLSVTSEAAIPDAANDFLASFLERLQTAGLLRDTEAVENASTTVTIVGRPSGRVQDTAAPSSSSTNTAAINPFDEMDIPDVLDFEKMEASEAASAKQRVTEKLGASREAAKLGTAGKHLTLLCNRVQTQLDGH
jgi:hypothetical protein